MYKYASATIDAFLDEGIAARKVLDYVLVFNVINLNGEMFVLFVQLLIERQSQYRYDMGDVGLI